MIENYKDDIVKSRMGCLGGSDAAMLAQIASLGYVPQSARERMAVCKGLIPNPERPATRAMQVGDYIEQCIYEHLASGDPRYESNPRWESNKYAKKNVRLICHPDIVMADEAKKVLNVYEVKTTKYDVVATRQTYAAQLYVEAKLAQERAASLGGSWRVRLCLVHYSTDGLDINEGIEFDPTRLTVRPVYFNNATFDIDAALSIVDKYLEGMDYYTTEDIVLADALPDTVRHQFQSIADVLREIKEREAQVEAFKTKLYDFLVERNIKSVKCDDFSFSVVRPTESATVDYKAIFNEEIAAKHPHKARRLEAKHKKVTKRKGYVTIKVSNNDK